MGPLDCWKEDDEGKQEKKIDTGIVAASSKLIDDRVMEDHGARKQSMIIHEEWRAILNGPKVPRRKRSAIEITECDCHEKIEILSEEEEEEEEELEKETKNARRKIKKKKKTAKEKTFEQAAEMPIPMRDRIGEMGGYNVQLLIEKPLTKTDLNANQGRFSVPSNKLRANFLTAEEEHFLIDPDENGRLNWMDVPIVGPNLRESSIRFKKWLIGSDLVNCLMTQWNSLAKENHLETGDNVQLWSFRVDRIDPATETTNSVLFFALPKLETRRDGDGA